jgi:hypothetical protein
MAISRFTPIVSVLSFVVLALAPASPVRAALGGTDGVVIPYAGKLELDGVLVNGSVDLKFDVMVDASTATVCDSKTISPVPVTNGEFAVTIARVLEACVKGKDVHLNISVRQPSGTGTFVALGKQRVTPVLSAVTSGAGDFAVTGALTSNTADIGSLAANTADIVSLAADSADVVSLTANTAAVGALTTPSVQAVAANGAATTLTLNPSGGNVVVPQKLGIGLIQKTCQPPVANFSFFVFQGTCSCDAGGVMLGAVAVCPDTQSLIGIQIVPANFFGAGLPFTEQTAVAKCTGGPALFQAPATMQVTCARLLL